MEIELSHMDLGALLAFDGLAAAEKITGRDYAEDRATEALGFLFHLDASDKKNTALKSSADTYYDITIEDYLEAARQEGFAVVLKLPFEGRAFQDAPCEETLYILFSANDGILLTFETFGSDRINSGDFYYNWLPESYDLDRYRFTSSGYFTQSRDQLVWIGSHDCRVGLRYHIQQLRDHGQFITPWRECPRLNLLTYMESKVIGFDRLRREALIADRISLLPEPVRKAIMPSPNQSETTTNQSETTTNQSETTTNQSETTTNQSEVTEVQR